MDNQNTNSQIPQDFEMGDSAKSTPKPQVAPAVPAPAPSTAPASLPKPFANQKAVMGCLGAFGGLMLIFLLLSFIFLAQSGNEGNPIATLLNLEQATFVNSLITFIHLIFIASALVAFIFAMIGLFRASMAKKGDIFARKQGLRTAMISGASLMIILVIWVFVYLYLDSKRVPEGPNAGTPIVTTPEDSLNLTAPIEVKFDATNIPFDSRNFKIVSYEWDFGDDETGTNRITSHIYTEKGTYEVVLKITLENKETNELVPGGEFVKIVSVANQALQAVFTADPQSGAAPLKVKFDASDSLDPDGNVETYEWDLDGDGQFDDAKGETTEYEYKKLGRYKVALRVTSTTGEFSVGEKEIIVEEAELPNAVIEILNEPVQFLINTQYTFKADKSTSPKGDIQKYEWDFGDGSKPVATKTALHTFATAGTYEVTLKVTDETGEEGEVTKLLSVNPPQGTPKAEIKTLPAAINNQVSGRAPFSVTFDATDSTDSDNNIVDYEWDFDNDGTTDAYGDTVTHQFLVEGIYTTTLQVIDSNRNIGKKSITVSIDKPGLTADVKVDIATGTAPLTVAFDASGSSYPGGKIVSYKWDFGDGTAPKFGPSSITHKYNEIGSYTATVTAYGDDTVSALDQILITVRETALQACFVSVFENGPAPLTTDFDPGCSTGSISKYFWDFGDGSTSTMVKPNHTFTSAGAYKVTLEVSDSDSNISKAELTVNVSQP